MLVSLNSSQHFPPPCNLLPFSPPSLLRNIAQEQSPLSLMDILPAALSLFHFSMILRHIFPAALLRSCIIIEVNGSAPYPNPPGFFHKTPRGFRSLFLPRLFLERCEKIFYPSR